MRSILIVDDMKINIVAMSGLLAQIPAVEIYEAHDGEEALECVHSVNARFNYIFMDVQMPRIDGIKASQVIKQWALRGEISYEPIIILLTAGGPDDAVALRESRADELSMKPMAVKELLKIFHSYESKYNNNNLPNRTS